MPFAAGQTYLFPLGSQLCHLWIIATEPDENGMFATVNFTSLKGANDQTVIIRAGEHRFVKWDTCVQYGLGELTSTERLQEFVDAGTAKMHHPIRADLVKLIVDGFDCSDFTKRRVREFVQARKTAARSQNG